MPIGRFTGDEYPSLMEIAFALDDVPTEHVRRISEAIIAVHEDISERITKDGLEYGFPIGWKGYADPTITVDWTLEIVRRAADLLFPAWAERNRELAAAAAVRDEEWKAKLKARNISRRLRRKVMERDGYRCVKCGTQIDLCIDHKVPVSKGGQATFENLQTLCRPCNSRKCARPDEAYPPIADRPDATNNINRHPAGVPGNTGDELGSPVE